MAGSATKRREKMRGGVAKRTLYSSHCFLLCTFGHFRWILLSLISGLVNHQNYILINLEPLDSRLFVCHSKLWWCQHQDYSACERQSLICNHKCWCKWYYRWWCWCKLRWDVKVWNAVSRPNEAAGCIILPTPQTNKKQSTSPNVFDCFVYFCHIRIVILIHRRYLSLGLSLGSWKVIICRTNGRALCAKQCVQGGELWVHGVREGVQCAYS